MDHRDLVLARAQRAGRLPSMVAGVVDGDALAWVGSAGDVVGPPADTQYRIGSITKTMTAVLVLQARQDGLLRLEDPLGEHVPGAPYADRTLRALLSHTSGLPPEPAGEWWERREGDDVATLLADNRPVPPRHPAGEVFLYSNLGYGLLGEVVARVRGRDWWTLVQERVLEPLGMHRTTYQPVAPYAEGHSVSHLLSTLTPEPRNDTRAMAPAGQLWSTVTDLAAYAGFVLRGHDGVLPLAVLEEASVEQLSGSEYGLGFRTDTRPERRLVGHTGTMPGFMASFFCDRARGTAFVGFANGTRGQNSVGLAHDVLGATPDDGPEPEPWRPTTEVPDDVRALVGTWHWGEVAYEVRWDEGELQVVEVRSGTAWEEFRRLRGEWRGTDGALLEVHPDRLVVDTYAFTRTPYETRG